MSVVFNGSKLSEATFANRAFRYGDGLFETMRFYKDGILNLQAHINRLSLGIRILKLKHPDRFMREWQDAAEELAKQECGANARIRLSVFRSGSGFYTPETNQLEWLLEAWPMEGEPYAEMQGMKTGLARTVRRPLWNLSSFKMLGSIPSVLCGIEAQERNLDELVMLNFIGRLSESGKSNIFLVIDSELHTPLPGEGQVEGTMKQELIQSCLKLGIKVNSRQIQEKDLDRADEILFSNAIQGLRYAAEFEGRAMKNTLYSEVRAALIKMLMANLSSTETKDSH